MVVTPVTPALQRLRREDVDLGVSLGYQGLWPSSGRALASKSLSLLSSVAGTRSGVKDGSGG